MHFLDANVFLRFITGDDPQKAESCRRLFKAMERNEVSMYTIDTVIAEVVYVLSSKALYGLTHSEVRARLQPILSLPGLKLPNRRVLLRALTLYDLYAVDFEDALSVAYMERLGIEKIVSYDRDFDRMEGVTRVEPDEVGAGSVQNWRDPA